MAVAVSAAFVACNKDKADNLTLDNYADSLAYYAGLTEAEGLMASDDSTVLSTLNEEAFLRGLEAAFADTTDAYIAGLQMGLQYHANLHNMSLQSGLDVNASNFVKGFRSALEAGDVGDSVRMENARILDELGLKFQQAAMEKFSQKMAQDATHPRAQADKKFVDDLKAADSSIQTSSTGLSYKIIENGTGEPAQVGSSVKVKYTGKLTDGTEFDSSHDTFVDFPVDPRQVIPGFAEALATFPAGTKATVYIPQDLAYGIRDNGPIPAGATLIFDIEIAK